MVTNQINVELSDPTELFTRALSTENGLELAQLARKWTKLEKDRITESFRFAVLSEGSAETYLPQLSLLSAARGHPFTYKVGTFNGISQDVLDLESEVYKYKPDIALIHLLPNRLQTPSLSISEDELSAMAQDEAAELVNLCRNFYEVAGCRIILTNFEQPWVEPYSGLPAGANKLSTYIPLINRALSKSAPSYVHIFDVHTLSNCFGRDRWHEPRLWHHAKQPMTHDAIALFARKFAGIISAIRGTTSKCLVLDLDNTLWGGVVGEDGVDGIRLGQGSAEGEAYRAFQIYLKSLKDRGVLLAVCSKNDPANARRPFEQHPEMVLKLEDISCFVANWESKADNCIRISQELNILTDSLVFIDDEKAEREIVRQYAPKVKILNMPADPSLFPRVIESSFLFESCEVTSEDLARTNYYQVEKKRKDLEQTATDLDSFLKSLNMHAEISSYRIEDVSRISQLFNKSNQFNLCTRRYGEKELQSVIEDEAVISFQIRLKDRFGDYGLVSMAHARPVTGDTVRLENWIMSCRVLKRGVEHLMCNHLIFSAAQKGFKTFEFDFYPTEKNSLVKDLYKKLGFEYCCNLDGNGERWSVRVEVLQPFTTHIFETQPPES